jgi:hypothetical protein
LKDIMANDFQLGKIKVFAYAPLGLTEDNGRALAAKLNEEIVKLAGEEVTVESLRFFPSTIVNLDAGQIQVAANSTVQVAGFPRVIETVLTFDKARALSDMQVLTSPESLF